MMDRKRLRHDGLHQASSPQPPKRHKDLHHGPHNVDEEERGARLSQQHEDYTIAWICALHIEMAAACAMLDGAHSPLPNCPNDTNTYALGSVQQHNVVIACLPEAQYGTINAANVITNLRHTFPSVRLGLMVGIGGGAPGKADIRLGDVVVGTRVMQCDMGKIMSDGQIQRTALPRHPAQAPGTAVSALRSNHELRPSRIPSILQNKL